MLESLSESSLTRTLKSLSVSPSFLSDDASHCWQNFSGLTSLRVGGPLLGKKSYDEIFTKLPALTTFCMNIEGKWLLDYALEKAFCPTSPLSATLQDFEFHLSGLANEPAPNPTQIVTRLLEANPTLCQNLRRIQGLLQTSGTHNPMRILELCPNLVYVDSFVPTWDELKSLPVCAKNFDSLFISCRASITQADIEWLAATFPSLEELDLCAGSNVVDCSTVTSLRSLSRLQSFNVRCRSAFNCFAFPPLRRLTIEVNNAAFDYSRFMDCLTAELYQLETLNYFGRGLSPSLCSNILSRLPNLDRICLSPCEAVDIPSPFVLSHSKLGTAAELETTFKATGGVVFGELPNIKSCLVTHNLLPALSSSMTTLRSLRIDDPTIEDNLDRLKLLPALVSIVFRAPSPRQLDAICTVTGLETLFLSNVGHVSTERLAGILGGLPRLRSFLLHQNYGEKSHDSVNWLKHDRLERFSYMALSTQAAISPQVLRIADAARLPCLQELTLRLEDIKRYEIVVEDLVSLRSVQFTGPPEVVGVDAQDFGSIRICNCPSLSSVFLTSVCLSSIELKNLPRVKQLQLGQFSMSGESRCIFDIPSLREYSLSAARPVKRMAGPTPIPSREAELVSRLAQTIDKSCPLAKARSR